MKKNVFKLVAIAFVCFFVTLGFSACEEKHTHNYVETLTLPTCTTQGFTTYACECGESYVDNYVEHLNHEFTEYISDNNATYDGDGTRTATCNRTACNEKDTIPDIGTKLQSGISFKTLAVNGTSIYGVVRNANFEFSFKEEILINGNVKFSVSKDKYGVQNYLTKIVPLNEGNNVFYLFEMCDEEILKTYTVTLRRRPIYTVEFEGEDISSQRVEEGKTATLPQKTPKKFGADFVHWEFDFSQPIMGNTSIKAEWFLYHTVLILESNENESDNVKNILDDNEDYQIFVLNIFEDDIPCSVEELNLYNQIIIVNVNCKDMPQGFEGALHSYVYDYGGNLFTIGGDDEEGNPNGYKYQYHEQCTYEKMLPVEIINYTPPVSVMLIIDASYSMVDTTDDKGNILFDGAKAGAIACLNALTKQDYIGLIMMGEEPDVILELTPIIQERKIKAAIDDMEDPKPGTGAIFSSAIKQAGIELNANRDKFIKQHVILVTDGKPNDPPVDYQRAIKELAAMGITVSIIGIGQAGDTDMATAAVLGNGTFYPLNSVKDLVGSMKEDLTAPDIKDMGYEDFYITIAPEYVERYGVSSESLPKLGGFYGTRLKEGATAILTGIWNVPIYARWNYGNGIVGSFMCDLNGTFSEEFLKDKNCIVLLNKILS